MPDSVVTRREFLKIGGTSLGALALGQFVPPPVAKTARQNGSLDANGDGYIPTMCEMCVWRCGVLSKVEQSRVVKLEGNPEHPHSKGKFCARGQAGLMNTYDPDRVLSPLVRVGKRGEGKFRKASWEDSYYNLIRPHKSLRLPVQDGWPQKWSSRTPTMAAKLTDHIWTVKELLMTLPLPGAVNT